MAEAGDSAQAFATDALTTRIGHFLSTSELYDAYLKWWKQERSSKDDKPLYKNVLVKQLTHLGAQRHRTSTQRGILNFALADS